MTGWGIVHMGPGMRYFSIYFYIVLIFESYKCITHLEIINKLKKQAKTSTNSHK